MTQVNQQAENFLWTIIGDLHLQIVTNHTDYPTFCMQNRSMLMQSIHGIVMGMVFGVANLQQQLVGCWYVGR